jgi:hypothetical protein
MEEKDAGQVPSLVKDIGRRERERERERVRER